MVLDIPSMTDSDQSNILLSGAIFSNFKVKFRVIIFLWEGCFCLLVFVRGKKEIFIYEDPLVEFFKLYDTCGHLAFEGTVDTQTLATYLASLSSQIVNTHTLLTTSGSVRGLGRQEKVSRRKVVISRRSWHAAIFKAKGQPHLEGFTVPME